MGVSWPPAHRTIPHGRDRVGNTCRVRSRVILPKIVAAVIHIDRAVTVADAFQADNHPRGKIQLDAKFGASWKVPVAGKVLGNGLMNLLPVPCPSSSGLLQ